MAPGLEEEETVGFLKEEEARMSPWRGLRGPEPSPGPSSHRLEAESVTGPRAPGPRFPLSFEGE